MELSTLRRKVPASPDSPNTYLGKLSSLIEEVPAYEELDDFVKYSERLDSSPAKISLIQFYNGSPLKIEEEFTEDSLPTHIEPLESSKLFVIENISAKVIEFLGSKLGVEYEFWLDHVSNSNWFRLEKIEKHLPALKSIQLESRYLRHRCISPREPKLKKSVQLMTDGMQPKVGSTRVPRVAGAFKPLERVPNRSRMNVSRKEKFKPFVLTRQHISMWFDASEDNKGWKTGIILLDPKFQPNETIGTCQTPSYRSFFPRSKSDTEMTYRTSFMSCLKQDPALKTKEIPCPFVILGNMYRLLASEWMVVNTCFERELNTIEWNLENGDARLESLHEYLDSLYVMSRRITLYEMLIKEQHEACRQRGRKHWNQGASASNHEAIEKTASTLETDFTFVSNLVEKNQQRVAKNISLIVALTADAKSHIGISNGKRMEILAVAAIFFLPFSVASSVMNVEGNLGSGPPRQLVFWTISLPSSLLLLCVYMLYRRSWAP